MDSVDEELNNRDDYNSEEESENYQNNLQIIKEELKLKTLKIE